MTIISRKWTINALQFIFFLNRNLCSKQLIHLNHHQFYFIFDKEKKTEMFYQHSSDASEKNSYGEKWFYFIAFRKIIIIEYLFHLLVYNIVIFRIHLQTCILSKIYFIFFFVGIVQEHLCCCKMMSISWSLSNLLLQISYWSNSFVSCIYFYECFSFRTFFIFYSLSYSISTSKIAIYD